MVGLALLVVTTSGVPLLYAQEITHAQHKEAYEASGPSRISIAEALPIVRQYDPRFALESIYATHGVYVADNFETGRRVTVDPSNGRVLGDFNPLKDDGAIAWTMSLLTNVHVCMLTCEEYAGYQPWLGNTIPGTGWLGFDGEGVSWGGLLLGITGVLLLFLGLSGIWLWWPGLRRWANGVRVRLRRGRYARDYDLHQVAGMVAVPLLLIWAVTGTGYEFGFVEKAWYGATPGDPLPERILESKPSNVPDIGPEAAVAAALKLVGERRVTALDIPSKKEKSATYGVWLADGFDPWRHNDYSGDLLVSVDRKSGAARVTYGGPEPRAQALWEDWNFMTHSGWVVGPWWRIVWLVLGLVPLVLAVTGLSTWLYKRGRRKRRAALA